MKIGKQALYAAVRQLSHVVDAKALIPILRALHLRAADGVLTIAATDLTTWIRAVIPCTGEFTAAVDARALAAAVRPAGKADKATAIDIEAGSDGKNITVSSLDSKVVLEALQATDFPTYPADDDWPADGSWSASELASALGWVSLAAGRDETRPQLTGVFIDAEHAVATDGHRLHLAAIRGFASGPCLLPGRAVSALLKLLPAADEVIAARAGELVRFQAGAFELTTKCVDARFPPYEQVIPAAETATFHTLVETAKLKAALARPPRAPGFVTLRINGEVLVERTVDAATSTARVRVIDSTHTGDDFVVGVDPRYLADALGDGSDLVTARYAGELDPIRIEPGVGRVAVVMPTRL